MDYSEIFSALSNAFPLSRIDSEYGMTEMFSQSYCMNDPEGIFNAGRTIRMICKEINDPLQTIRYGKAGQLGFIDLANIDSLAFVLTEDMGLLL